MILKHSFTNRMAINPQIYGSFGHIGERRYERGERVNREFWPLRNI